MDHQVLKIQNVSFLVSDEKQNDKLPLCRLPRSEDVYWEEMLFMNSLNLLAAQICQIVNEKWEECVETLSSNSNQNTLDNLIL